MGLFNFFKKLTIVHDEFFGSLQLVASKNTADNYFEGRGYFSPTDSETDFLIQADIEGPTFEQKEFYKTLQTEFNDYIKKITPLIEDEFRNWQEAFEIKDFTKEFQLVCITIPRFDNNAILWDMAFSTIHDLNHHVTIDFIGNEPNSIIIDG